MCVGVTGMFVCVPHIGLSVALCVRETEKERDERNFFLSLPSHLFFEK